MLVALVSLALPAALAHGTPRGAAGKGAGKSGPRIKDGRFEEAGSEGDVYLDVDVKARRVVFHFKLYCWDPFAPQYVTSGPDPGKGGMSGNRRGAKVFVYGEYSGLPASGPGTSQVADWTLNGKFTTATHFDGRLEYEAATSPPPPYPVAPRPQCIDWARVHLDRLPPG